MSVMTSEVEEAGDDAAVALKYMQRRVPLGRYALAMRMTVLTNQVHRALIEEDIPSALRWIASTYQFTEQYALDGGSLQLAWLHTFLPRFEDSNWMRELSKASSQEIEARIARLVEPDTVGVESSYVKELNQFKKLSAELAKAER